MEERNLGREKKEMVETNKNQELKLLEFVLLEGMITQPLEWVMVVGMGYKIVRVIDLDLDLLVANLLQVGKA